MRTELWKFLCMNTCRIFYEMFCFSVRSAYYLEREHQFRARFGREQPETSWDNPVWDVLWKLHVSSKVKIFVWRALHGVILGKCIVHNRHTKVSPNALYVEPGMKIFGTSYSHAHERANSMLHWDWMRWSIKPLATIVQGLWCWRKSFEIRKEITDTWIVGITRNSGCSCMVYLVGTSRSYEGGVDQAAC